MAESPLTPAHQSFGQGSNSHSLSPTRNFEIGYSSPPRREHEIFYQHLYFVYHITRQFAKEFRLIPGIQDLPYASKKPNTTPIVVVVSSVVEAVLATLEVLAKAIENREEPPVFQQGEQDTLVILGSDSGIGGGGKDEPTDSETERLDSKEEEEDEEEEDMADQNLEWMT